MVIGHGERPPLAWRPERGRGPAGGEREASVLERIGVELGVRKSEPELEGGGSVADPRGVRSGALVREGVETGDGVLRGGAATAWRIGDGDAVRDDALRAEHTLGVGAGAGAGDAWRVGFGDGVSRAGSGMIGSLRMGADSGAGGEAFRGGVGSGGGAITVAFTEGDEGARRDEYGS